MLRVAVYEYDERLYEVFLNSNGQLAFSTFGASEDSAREFMDEIMKRKRLTPRQLLDSLPDYLTGVVHAEVVAEGAE